MLDTPGAHGQHFIGTAFDRQKLAVLVRVQRTHKVAIFGAMLHTE